MSRRTTRWLVALGLFGVLALLLLPRESAEVTRTSMVPAGERNAVLRGVTPELLEATTVAEDFLWGAAKYAAVRITAPSGADLVLEELRLSRRGGNDAVLPSVWVRANRKRVYAETPLVAGVATVRAFPQPHLAEDVPTRDVEAGGERNRLMETPETSLRIAAGDAVVLEVFGIFDQDAITEPFDAQFCLDWVKGYLEDAAGQMPAASQLNETCWPMMTTTPVE